MKTEARILQRGVDLFQVQYVPVQYEQGTANDLWVDYGMPNTNFADAYGKLLQLKDDGPFRTERVISP